ncbi:SETMAR [Cordylochernes scorpioides]|uniref:SETMAR n=1 Tax=Cordylochernes scorpioides TaxID=51811 RepID=A0ABY6KXX7_9ARAC|nr:SETMAR [Cordylochernes scorpioides]
MKNLLFSLSGKIWVVDLENAILVEGGELVTGFASFCSVSMTCGNFGAVVGAVSLLLALAIDKVELGAKDGDRRVLTNYMLVEIDIRHEKKPFLHRIVTSDEKWIHFSNPTRQKSWGLPDQFPKQTPRPNRFGKKGNALHMVGPDRRSIFRASETWQNGQY